MSITFCALAGEVKVMFHVDHLLRPGRRSEAGVFMSITFSVLAGELKPAFMIDSLQRPGRRRSLTFDSVSPSAPWPEKVTDI